MDHEDYVMIVEEALRLSQVRRDTADAILTTVDEGVCFAYGAWEILGASCPLYATFGHSGHRGEGFALVYDRLMRNSRERWFGVVELKLYDPD